MEDYITNKYDDQFSEFKWIPWVGKDYDKHKILALGASHTAVWDGVESIQDPEEKRKKIKEIEEKGFQYPRAHIDIAHWHATSIDNQDMNTIHRKFAKVLLGKKDANITECGSVWSSIAFHNAIQRVMTHGTSTEFDDAEGQEAWDVFKNLVSIIKPKVCIAWGFKVIDHWANTQDEFKDKYQWHEKRNNFYPRTAMNLDIQGNKISIIAIRHPSIPVLNYATWYDFLMQHCGSELAGLEQYKEK